MKRETTSWILRKSESGNMTKFSCKICGSTLRVADSSLGKTIQCPECKNAIDVPDVIVSKRSSPSKRRASLALVIALALIIFIAIGASMKSNEDKKAAEDSQKRFNESIEKDRELERKRNNRGNLGSN